jgi:hypothetical protein
MKFKWLVTLPLIRGDKIIKNIDLPSCRNCMYYKPNTYNDFASTLNKCEKFGMKDIITDEIHYDFADLCRRDEDKCGNKGQFFTIEENLPAKMITHFMVKNSPIALVILLTVFSVYITLNL